MNEEREISIQWNIEPTAPSAPVSGCFAPFNLWSRPPRLDQGGEFVTTAAMRNIVLGLAGSLKDAVG